MNQSINMLIFMCHIYDLGFPSLLTSNKADSLDVDRDRQTQKVVWIGPRNVACKFQTACFRFPSINFCIKTSSIYYRKIGVLDRTNLLNCQQAKFGDILLLQCKAQVIAVSHFTHFQRSVVLINCPISVFICQTCVCVCVSYGPITCLFTILLQKS